MFEVARNMFGIDNVIMEFNGLNNVIVLKRFSSNYVMNLDMTLIIDQKFTIITLDNTKDEKSL